MKRTNVLTQKYLNPRPAQPGAIVADEQPERRLIIFPANTPNPFPAGTWQRLPDGRIEARLTLEELRLMRAWLDMLAGEDVPDDELLPTRLPGDFERINSNDRFTSG